MGHWLKMAALNSAYLLSESISSFLKSKNRSGSCFEIISLEQGGPEGTQSAHNLLKASATHQVNEKTPWHMIAVLPSLPPLQGHSPLAGIPVLGSTGGS